MLFFNSDTLHILTYCYTYLSSQSIIVLLNDIHFFLVNVLTSMVSWQLCRTLANFVFLRNNNNNVYLKSNIQTSSMDIQTDKIQK